MSEKTGKRVKKPVRRPGRSTKRPGASPTAGAEILAEISKRDEKGRFLPGAVPGPGRPRGSGSGKLDEIKELLAFLQSRPLQGHLTYDAMCLRDEADELEEIRKCFPPAIVEHMERMVDLRKVALAAVERLLAEKLTL